MRVGGATADASGGGRRERRKAWTRRELILAGRELFSEKELYESRIEDLTRHPGMAAVAPGGHPLSGTLHATRR